MSRLLSLTMMSAALLLGVRSVCGQSPWYEGFEGPETSWRAAGGDAPFQVLKHQRIQGEAFTGDGCEHLAISGTGGTSVYFGHDTGRPRVIAELSPTVRVKADRAGLQMLAQIVLPRTKNPRTGQPISALVRGSSYTTVGRWQQLRIDDVPQRLLRQTRILRTQVGADIDPREAYVERVLLNIYGGPGVTRVWIDDLDIGGYVGAQSGTSGWSAADPVSVSSIADAPADPAQGHDRRAATDQRRIRPEGSVLLLDGRPIFPRIIQYQGEPLTVLKRLGFNAVWLSEVPTPELLDEADRSGLWLVCPPPLTTGPSTGSRTSQVTPAVVEQYDRVLAWDLGHGLSTADLEQTRMWAEQVRSADRQLRRPLVCQPDVDLREFSRSVGPDFLMVGRSPLGTSLELADYGRWIQQRQRLARPGTPIWTTVQTQPAPGLRQQWAGLGLGGASPGAFSSDQIRLLLYTAITTGIRGLLFQSHSPLDAPDADTRWRAMTLELLNLELALIEPWLAAGNFVARVSGSDPDAIATLLQTDRARLLVSIRSVPQAQFVPGQSAADSIWFVVPGVPESNNVYLLSPGALEPLSHKRVTGGTRVTLGEPGLTSLVLLTQDPLVVNSMSRLADQIGRRAAQLQRDLAAAKLEAVERVDHQLSSRVAGPPQSPAWLGAARHGLQSSDHALGAGDYASAYRRAQQAMRPLRMVERAHWERLVSSLASPVSCPTTVSFATLPWQLSLIEQIASAPAGPNLLAGGDFEDPGTVLQAGWRHFQHRSPGIHAQADLVPGAAYSGRYGLRLMAHPSAADNPPALVETPASWMTSPPVAVAAGQLVCIHGWVRVPAPITGSVDGLMIVDSLAGESLAERIGVAEVWKEFSLYRVASRPRDLTVTFLLSGMGEAWVDDVTIHALPLQGGRPVYPEVTSRVHFPETALQSGALPPDSPSPRRLPLPSAR